MNLKKLKITCVVTNNCQTSDDVSNDRHFEDESPRNPADGKLKMENGKWKINGKEHPNIFNSKKRYGFTLDEDTEIVSEDINLSPLRGKYPPEAGERGLKSGYQGLKRGFTLAEVLIALVVIGVVAAITIPVLHQNTSGKEWNAAKQKARAGLAEAFKLASVNQDLPNISAKEYVKTVLPKYLKLAKTCDTAQECGFSDKIKTVEGSEVDITGEWKWSTNAGDFPWCWNGVTPTNDIERRAINDEENTDAAFFQTVDGVSVSMLYNPNCAVDPFDKPAFDYSIYSGGNRAFAADQMAGQMDFDVTCFSAVYDMNGSKGPNTAGKDVGFAGSFYTGVSARSAAVLPVKNDTSTADWYTASRRCKNLSPAGDYDLPSIDEAVLMFFNYRLFTSSAAGERVFWTRSAVGGASDWFRTGIRLYGYQGLGHASDNRETKVRCVRADKLM